MQKFIAAAVQWTPVVHDAKAGAEKAAEAVAAAAKMGAKLVVFPETWLQGYPYFTGVASVDPEYGSYLAAYWNAAIDMRGEALAPVREAAKRASAIVSIGVTERAGGTLYNTQVYIGADGALLGAHRKLMPTLNERMVWGMGDGSDLDAYDTPLGKLGGLICFEHQMAPARFALNGLGVQLHASVWPGYPMLNGIVDASTRHLAFENGCFVIVAREVMAQDRIPKAMPPSKCNLILYDMQGGSAIVGPDGQYLAAPVFGKEAIVTAEIDLSMIARSKVWCDGTGHYSRPDVFQLRWDKRPKPAIEIQR